jgi:ribonuclease HII
MNEERLAKERERLAAMREFEEKYGSCRLICGIDEAGRGPLAGPVVAGAVILPKDCEILYLNDSKKLWEAKRETLFEEITGKAVSYGIGLVSAERIDTVNILNATFEAMKDAYESCLSKIADREAQRLVLVDGNRKVPGIEDRQECIVKGDARSQSIAAASILAKVTRDRILIGYDEKYPGYGFAKHKGYGTKEHIEALRRLGPSEIHRMSFLKGILS